MSAPPTAPTWAATHAGITVAPTGSAVGVPVTDLVTVGLRDNPRRAQLLVSTVLGKHVPTDPALVLGAGRLLGRLVGAVLTGRAPDPAWSAALPAALAGDPTAATALLAAVGPPPARYPGVVVLGYAETATGLGHAVADVLPGALALHSTRRTDTGVRPAAGFDEEHSHAVGHLILLEDPLALNGSGPLVLVDDELSTGRTLLNTITALQAHAPRRHYVAATLVDLRDAAARAALTAVADRLGVRIDVVALADGSVRLPAGPVAVPTADAPRSGPVRADVVRLDGFWPVGLRDGARHGYRTADREALDRAVPALAATVADHVLGDVLVLGTEELMYVPLRLAVGLRERGLDVRYSTTTRSPAVALDQPGYPLRDRLVFDGADGRRYAYNVASARARTVVLVGDELPTGLVEAVAAQCRRLVLLPVTRYRPGPPPDPQHGPGFGSYAPEEVSWLLRDLSGVALEAPTEEREEAVQSGGAHYAESLPVEYLPSAAYGALFEAALEQTADRVATAVGVLTELVLSRRPGAVLASLARAGVPVGILMRRWASWRHGRDLPHRAVSIVRGRGIDTVALRWLAAHHDPADVVFVDGWTGKGAIVRELEAALAEHAAATGARFAADLAVLADPGHCVRTFGTREDFLIPSACLNSTVSGLVSRTVLNDRLIAPGDFHGAKFYAELAPADVSHRFLDAISDRFAAVAGAVATAVAARVGEDVEPDWSGWAAIEGISAAYGIGSVNLVKPGVGETTRVLLRRVPWRVLVRAGVPAGDLAHVRQLAAERGVPVEEVADLPYACVGLIHPRFTRGATGADGMTTATPGPTS